MRLGPLVILLVLLEILLQSFGVVGCLIPHLGLADLKHERSIVVFLSKVPGLTVLGNHIVKELFEHHILLHSPLFCE